MVLCIASLGTPASASRPVESGGPNLVQPHERIRVYSLGYSTSFSNGRTELSIWTRGANRAAVLSASGRKSWARPVGFSSGETLFEWKVLVPVTPAMRNHDAQPGFRIIARNSRSGVSRWFLREAYVQLYPAQL